MNYFTKTITAFLVIFSLAACKKDIGNQPPTPKVTFSRTLVFPNRNGEVKASAYTNNPLLESIALVADGKLRLFLNLPATTDGSTGESIALDIAAGELTALLKKEYTFTNAAAKILNARFSYTNRLRADNSWTSITETAMGVNFGGSFTITKVDLLHRTISGSFSISANSLVHDPTLKNIGQPIDPANSCNLLLTATFENIRVH